MSMERKKPLGAKSYGHIAHLPGSRMGPGDHACHEGQKHEPLVVFDLMVGTRRVTCYEMVERVRVGSFVTPKVIHRGPPLSIEDAMRLLNIGGFHGARDPVEGAVWRVERNELVDPGRGRVRRRVVDFLAKFVRPDKVDGFYLPEISGGDPVWNWRPH
ncbi:MAG TPA: hypothetical protein VJH03_06735 [Blastocatellia bacterium]|nr:hypothetical protein [Blastocatellia bacterium]